MYLYDRLKYLPNMSEEDWNKLSRVKIRTRTKLLEKAGTAYQRRELSDISGVSTTDLLGYANACDLMRLIRLGPSAVILLRAAGVYTLRDLRYRNAEHLHHSLNNINNTHNLSRRPVPLNSVRTWIKQANVLELCIFY